MVKILQNDARIKEKLAYICRQFRLPGELILYRLIPNGHINTAYYAALYDGKEVRQFLVQKVNWYVFKDPGQHDAQHRSHYPPYHA